MKTIELTFRRWLSVGPWDKLFCWINVSGALEGKGTGELFEQGGSLRRTGGVITAVGDWRPGKGLAEAVLQFSELSGQIAVMSVNESESNSVNSEPWDPSLTFSCGFGLRAVSSATIWDKCRICSFRSGMTSTKSVWIPISDVRDRVAAFSTLHWVLASAVGLGVTGLFSLHWMPASLVCAFGGARCHLNWECLAACSARNDFRSCSWNPKSSWKLSWLHQVHAQFLACFTPLDALRLFKYSRFSPDIWSKLKIVTSQWLKSRIWDTMNDWYIITASPRIRPWLFESRLALTHD